MFCVKVFSLSEKKPGLLTGPHEAGTAIRHKRADYNSRMWLKESCGEGAPKKNLHGTYILHQMVLLKDKQLHGAHLCFCNPSCHICSSSMFSAVPL